MAPKARSRARNGAVSLHAVTCLPTVTGAWAHPGGGALYSNRSLYHINDSLIVGAEMEDRSIRELDQSRLGAVLTGDKRDLLDGPPVMAMTVFRKMFVRMGFIRYMVLANLVLFMACLPIKMVLRWAFNLKYLVYIPEWFFNI